MMARLGDDSFYELQMSGQSTFAFVDADNYSKGFEQALRNRGCIGDDLEIFSRNRLAEAWKYGLKRTYIYSALPLGHEPESWISELRSSSRMVFRSTVLKQVGKKVKQEGVDVALAVEAMQCASKRTMDSCAVFSGDGDLLPLIDALVSEGITTIVCSFDDPEIGDVARRIRDSADGYIHMGTTLLSRCLVEQHALVSQSGSKTEEAERKGLSPSLLGRGETQLVENENGTITLLVDQTKTGSFRTLTAKTILGARALARLHSLQPRDP